MIVLRVELWPAGSESRAREIGTAIIVNDGTGNRQRGNYNVVLGRAPSHPLALHATAYDHDAGRVEGHDRMKTPIWELIRKALNAVTLT